MRNILTALLFFISVSLFSQDEKRLALVIGNANYDKGELKNPVNDARLIASTLDSLDFDVILKENLEKIGFVSWYERQPVNRNCKVASRQYPVCCTGRTRTLCETKICSANWC